MGRILLIAIVVFLVVTGGGLSILWFMQASQIKTNVENAIANINAQQKYITYESIQTSGFPKDVIVSIVKPHITGRIDTLLKQVAPPPPNGQPVPEVPEWDEDLALDGAVSIGINALSDHYTLGITGNWHDNSKIGGQSVALNTQATGNSVCSLQLAHGSSFLDKLWSFKALLGNRDFVQDFRMVDCVFTSYTGMDPVTNEALISSGGGRLYVTNTPQGNTRQMRFYVKSIDAQITPAGDKLAAAYFQLMAPGYPLTTKFSSYGKQNIEVDLSYAGPTSLQGDAKNIPLDINLSKFSINNQIYTIDAMFHLANSMNGDARTAKVTLAANSVFSEQYDAMLQDVAHRVIEQLYLPTNPQNAKLQPVLQANKPDDLYAAVAPAIPNLHSLGKITQGLDVSYAGAASMMGGDFTLANLELSATPYGITGKGTAKTTAGNMIPAMNITLNCTNCLHLIDDAADYMGRLQKAVAVFNPTQAVGMQVDPAEVQGLKSFMTALAEPAKGAGDQSVFTYTIVGDGTPNITISGKPMSEVMMLFNQYLAPTLQKHPAGAPQH